MAEDWSVDVRKYAPNASSSVIEAIEHYCGIALQHRDSSLVSFNDEKEVARVRENFLRKKLGLTKTDAELNEAIAEVGERMKPDHTRNRVTVYYLLAEHFRKLSVFGGVDAPLAAAAVGAGAAAAAAAATIRPTVVEPPPRAQVYGGAAAMAAPAPSAGLMRWLPWILGALLLLALLIWFLTRQQAVAPVAAVPAPVVEAPVVAAAPAAPTAPVAAEARVAAALPATVHFALGSAAIGGEDRDTIAAAAQEITKSGAKVAVTGYTDRTGNLPLNTALARHRAQSVQQALTGAGVPASSIEMVAPAAVENGAPSVADADARRVEIRPQ